LIDKDTTQPRTGAGFESGGALEWAADTRPPRPSAGKRAIAVRFCLQARFTLSAPGFSRSVKRAAAAADLGIKGHAHMLRHACGYKLANDGHDVRAIQAHLKRSRSMNGPGRDAERVSTRRPVEILGARHRDGKAALIARHDRERHEIES
jgi:hypothetical protein